ncbi:hypothetical protein ACFLT2_14835 [Acidobacteriota bacterium]
MKKLKRPSLCALTGFGLVFLLVAPVLGARVQEDAEIKYASILGDYEFDMSSIGMGVMTVTFYLEEGELLVVTETSSEPGKLEPVQGKEFVFIVEDPDEGTFNITFLKDETGKYTKCRIANENMNLDVDGNKI